MGCAHPINPLIRGVSIIIILFKKADNWIRLIAGTLSSKCLCTWIALFSQIGPLHYLLYSFTYLVAVAASEQIAFLTQRKAQLLLHKAYSPRVMYCLACYVVFWGCFRSFVRENICKIQSHIWGATVVCLCLHAHFWNTDLCIMLLLCMEHYSWRQWEIYRK